MMDDRQQANNVQGLIDNFKKLLALNLDYARLTAAEKLTILLSTIAFYSMVCILGTLVLIFVSIGVGHLLATTVARVAAYLYVAVSIWYSLSCSLCSERRFSLTLQPASSQSYLLNLQRNE